MRFKWHQDWLGMSQKNDVMDTTFQLIKTPQGRYRLTTLGADKAKLVRSLLSETYLFAQQGDTMPALYDEGIYPDYVRGDLVILSGWDNWYGYDWLADNAETDEFLLTFYQTHCANN